MLFPVCYQIAVFQHKSPSPMVASVAPDLAEVAPLARTLTEQPVHQYSRVRKIAIVFMMSWVAFTTSFSSAALFPAISDIASDFGTTRSVIDASNAAVFICLAISGFLWVPLMQSLGRRYAYYAAVVIFFILSIATAAAPTIKVWFAMRCVSMLEGTIFHIAGQALIADIFPPVRVNPYISGPLADHHHRPNAAPPSASFSSAPSAAPLSDLASAASLSPSPIGVSSSGPNVA